MGGGVTTDNAMQYLDAGASHVIVTSFVFREGRLDEERLKALVRRWCTRPCHMKRMHACMVQHACSACDAGMVHLCCPHVDVLCTGRCGPPCCSSYACIDR